MPWSQAWIFIYLLVTHKENGVEVQAIHVIVGSTTRHLLTTSKQLLAESQMILSSLKASCEKLFVRIPEEHCIPPGNTAGIILNDDSSTAIIDEDEPTVSAKNLQLIKWPSRLIFNCHADFAAAYLEALPHTVANGIRSIAIGPNMLYAEAQYSQEAWSKRSDDKLTDFAVLLRDTLPQLREVALHLPICVKINQCFFSCVPNVFDEDYCEGALHDMFQL